MSGRKLQFRALIGLVAVIAIVVGVLVYPVPKEALATNLVVKLEVTDWGWPIDPYDLTHVAQMYNNAMEPVGEPFDLLLYFDGVYKGTFVDAPSYFTYVEIDWNGGGWDWGFDGQGQAFGDPPVVVSVTGLTTLVQVWCSWNGM